MPKPPSDPFTAIDAAALREVSGGRTLTRTGPDPAVTSMMTQLVESIKLVSVAQDKQKAESAQVMQQMMGMMQQKRG